MSAFTIPWEEKGAYVPKQDKLNLNEQQHLRPWKQRSQATQWGTSNTPKLGGGIRERIVALQSATGMSELDFTPVKESRTDEKISRFSSSTKIVKTSVFCQNDRMSEESSIDALKMTSGPIFKEELLNNSPVQQKKNTGIAFEVDFGESGRKRYPPCVPPRLKDKAARSPTKQKEPDKVKSTPKSPTTKKESVKVEFYLPVNLKSVDTKQGSLNSEDKVAPDLNPVTSQLRDSFDQDSQESSSKSKGVAFEIGFGGKTSQQHDMTTAKLRHTPFRLKRFQAKKIVAAESQTTSSSVQDGVVLLGNSDTRPKSLVDKPSGELLLSENRLKIVDSVSDKVKSQHLKDAVQETDEEAHPAEQLSSKPSLVRHGTYKFEKFASAFESVRKQESDVYDRMDASVEKGSDVCYKSQAMQGSEDVSTLSEDTAEQIDQVSCTQVGSSSAGVPSVDMKRKALIRSGTYNAEKVVSALDSFTKETFELPGWKSEEIAPNVSGQTSSKQFVSEEENQCCDELSDGESSTVAPDQACLSVSLPEHADSPGKSVGQLTVCGEDVKHQTNEDYGVSLSLEQSHCVSYVTSNFGQEDADKSCIKNQCSATLMNEDTYAMDELAEVHEKANVMPPLQQSASAEHSTELNIPQELQNLNMQEECAVTKDLNEHMHLPDQGISKEQEGTADSGKRGTYSLEEVAEILGESSDGGVIAGMLDELTSSTDVPAPGDCSLALPGKRGTYSLDEVAGTLEQKSLEGDVIEVLDDLANSVEMLVTEDQEPDLSVPGKRGTYSLDEVAGTHEQKQDELMCSLEMTSVGENNEVSLAVPGKRGTYTLDEVADTLEQQRFEGGVVVDVLNALASSVEMSVSENQQSSTAPGKRGTYTLDEVAETLEDANTRGRGIKEALENETTFSSDDEKNLAKPLQRGTYTLDGVANVLDKASDNGGAVVDALEYMAGEHQSSAEKSVFHTTAKCPQTENTAETSVSVLFNQSAPQYKLNKREDSQLQKTDPVENRGTYTLDEVSVALQAASMKGIPLVQALENLTKAQEAESSAVLEGALMNSESQESLGSIGQSSQQSFLNQGPPVVGGDRGTYTLEGVSDCLEVAKSKGLPLVDALASLAGGHEASSPQSLSTPTNRGTYTLDDVSHSIEAAKEKGLPIVELLDQLAGTGGEVTKRTPDAVPRRQQNLINRKTYALARPLETIGEDGKLKLFDGTTRHMLSSSAVKKLEGETTKEASTAKSIQTKGLVDTLDFLTSACEVLLSTAAKKTVHDLQRQELSRGNSTEIATENSSKVDRNTYSLEDVALTVEGAKEAGLPVIEALKKLSSAQHESGSKVALCTNLARYTSKSDSALTAAKASENPDRHTYSMDDMSQVLETATSSGLSVIQALDKLTKDLARFKVANAKAKYRGISTSRENFPSNSSRAKKKARLGERSAHSLVSGTDESCFPPLSHKAYSFDSVASTSEWPGEPQVPVMKTSNLSETPLEACESTEWKLPSTNSQSPESGLQAEDSKRGTYTLETVSTSLDTAKKKGLPILDILQNISAEPSEQDTDGARVHFPESTEESRTLILDHAEHAMDGALKQGLPLVGALEDTVQTHKMSQGDDDDKWTSEVSAANVNLNESSSGNLRQNESPPLKPWKNRSQEKTCPSKPERKLLKKSSLDLKADPFFVEIFSNLGSHLSVKDDDGVLQHLNEKSPYQSGSPRKISQMNGVPGSNTDENVQTTALSCMDQPPKQSEMLGRPSSDHTDVNFESSEGIDVKSVVRGSSPTQTVCTKSRAMWRASGSVLDKISNLLDSAEESGLSAVDALERAASFCTDEGEIEESDDNADDKSEVVTSQMTLLRMQLEEKRRHIEAEKRRTREQWEEQRRQVGHTAFWYMMGKARGAGQELSEGPGAKGQVPFSNNMTSLDSHQLKESPRPQQTPPDRAEYRGPNPHRTADIDTTTPEQQSPPIARSSPIGSPVAWQQVADAQEQEYETREFRLSNFPPRQETLDTPPQSARKCWGVTSSTPASAAPFSPPEPAGSTTATSGISSPHPSSETHVTRPWKDVAMNQAPFTPPQTKTVPSDIIEEKTVSPAVPVWKGVAASPVPFTPPHPAEVATSAGGGSFSTPQPFSETEVTPQRKGVALFVGEETSFGNESMTPEQLKKKERFLRQRQKKQEEEKSRKEELEKKRRREAKQREDAIRKMEDEKQRAQAEERKAMRARPQERGTPSRETQLSQTPEGYSTYRATAVPRAMYEEQEDMSLSPSQKSGFSDFSGPQCYVKPSGKSNRKIITNAISYVCLSGTVNKDQKDKCLQAIAESGGYHFMVLFKDSLKFRGLYSYNPESDQAFKVFGIGPRIITGKMVENLYKYNSGGKEFTKIFAKTLSISIDGLTIQKAYWQSNKPAVQSKTMSNLKRTPRPTQR